MSSTRTIRTKAEQEVRDSEPKREGAVYYGICTTCNYAPECVNSTNSENPVLFCEMFDDYVEPVRKEKPAVQPKPAPKEPETGELKGLCVNCENRATCNFPKPEGGVWHCEEYV
jgi:hypothetical protein